MKDSEETPNEEREGSIELVAIGLLAALILVLGIPVLDDIGGKFRQPTPSSNSAAP